jgi:cytochrome b
MTQVAERRGRNLSIRSRFDLLFDLFLLLAYGVVFSLDFTGEKWHEWFGLILGVAFLVHLALHWDWVVRTARRIATTTGRRRWTFVVNLLLTFDLVLCIGSGILISRYALPSLGINFFPSQSWTNIHEKTADIAIGLIGIHVAIDWRWITTVTKRMLHVADWRSDGRDRAEN